MPDRLLDRRPRPQATDRPALLLFTGRGGVGKTTAAAATAALVADRGRKVLVVSADPAHSLADALSAPLGAEPREVWPGLGAMQVEAQRRFEERWAALRGRLSGVLGPPGAADPGGLTGLIGLAGEELTAPPGALELLALLEVRDQVVHGPWDAVVVDCAATAETLRLLALPEALAFYVERLWPTHRRIVRSPWARILGEPWAPPVEVMDAIGGLHGELTALRALLADPAATSVRLVLTPESVVVAEARRTVTALALHGYPIDSVVANRVFPAEVAGSPWGASWRSAQTAALAELAGSVPGLPVRTATYRAAEPVGVPALLELARELYGSDDPLAAGPVPAAPEVARDGEDYVLTLALPFVDRSAVRLSRSGDELVVTVGEQRRRLALPSGLRRCVAVGASAGDGAVRVRFRPDPVLWPGGPAS